MSTITTQTRTARTVLRDYELHHSPAPSSSNDAASAHQARNSPPWPADYRRIPPYRPADRDRDVSQIRVYTSGIERAFVTVMFAGVFINAVSSVVAWSGMWANDEQTAAKTWRATVGRINGGIMRYPVGGEF